MTNVLDTKTFSNIEEIMFKEFSPFPWYYAPNVLAEDNTYVESDQCDLVIFGRGSGVLDSPTTEVPTPAYDGS